MTEGKKIGQWLVGIVLLFLFLVTAFIPWITLSGDDYVDAAVNVHEYAREQDAVVADAAGAFTFISSYQKDSDLRNAWVVSYEKGIKSRFGNKTSFSGFTWGRWCLRESTPLVLPQIQFENYFSNQKSAGRKIFFLYGMFHLSADSYSSRIPRFLYCKKAIVFFWRNAYRNFGSSV